MPMRMLPGLVEGGVLSAQAATLVCLLRWARPDGTAFCPRRGIAEATGLSETAVKNALAALKRKGAVETAEPGHNGRATVYRVRGL